MRRTWPYIFDTASIRTHHTSTCYTEHAHIQTADISSVSSYNGIIDGRTSVFDDTDIRCRTTYFKIYTVRSAQIHQTSHHRGCRSGKHRQYRTFLHLADLHNTAVTSHDHKRHFHTCASDTLLCRISSVQHFRQDRSIDRSCPCTACKSVKLCDLTCRRRFEPHIFRNRTDPCLIFHIVYTVRFTGNNYLRPFSYERFDRICHKLVRQFLITNEAIVQMDKSSGP